VGSGRWLAEWVVDNAPRIPVRNAELLSRHHGGLTGDALAAELVRNAARASAAIGAATGALAAAEELAPPAWLALPLELVAETAGVAVVELKLVAELHEVYGRPVTGSLAERGTALVRAWAEQRGVGGADASRAVRDEVVRLARRRLVRRMGRNLTSFAPLLIGAAAGAAANQRATKAVGQAVAADLASRPRP
jgi:hypothetical protein